MRAVDLVDVGSHLDVDSSPLRFGGPMTANEYHLYSAADVARLARIGAGQVRRWTRPDGDSTRRALLQPWAGGALFTFLDVIELQLLGELRRHGIPLSRIRRCMDRLADRWETSRPFTRREPLERLRTAGLEDLDRQQFVWREIVSPYLNALEFDERDAQAIRWWPRGASGAIVVDPAVAFGRPLLAEHRVPTDLLRLGVKAGDSIADLAAAYEIPEEAVREAVDFENALRAAAATWSSSTPPAGSRPDQRLRGPLVAGRPPIGGGFVDEDRGGHNARQVRARLH